MALMTTDIVDYSDFQFLITNQILDENGIIKIIYNYYTNIMCGALLDKYECNCGFYGCDCECCENTRRLTFCSQDICNCVWFKISRFEKLPKQFIITFSNNLIYETMKLNSRINKDVIDMIYIKLKKRNKNQHQHTHNR